VNTFYINFRQVDVFLNDKNVSSSNGTHPFQTYYENLLNYPEDAEKTHLTTALWYKDTAGHFNTLNEKKYIYMDDFIQIFQN